MDAQRNALRDAQRPSKAKWILIAGGLVLLFWGIKTVQNVCLSAWFSYRVTLKQCPDGRLRQTVHLDASGLRRGGPGSVSLGIQLHYTVSAADEARSTWLPDFEPLLWLVDRTGKETPLSPKEPW